MRKMLIQLILSQEARIIEIIRIETDEHMISSSKMQKRTYYATIIRL
jgi:hypothetical protein